MFDTFGPYHLARLNAVGAVLPIGLEVANRSAIYDWDPTSRASTFERKQLGLPRGWIFFGYDIVDNMHFAHGTAEARADEAAERNRLALLDRFFLASARFVPNKNLIGLIDAYAHYRQGAGASACGLVLLGDRAQRAESDARIAAHGIGDHVALPGFKQYGDLPAYYGLAGAFVHVSRVEPWGLVVNEAMAAGLPVVVSSSCGCAPELVTEGKNGFVVEAGDIGILAVRLAELAGMDPNARSEMGERSSEIIAPWSPARFAEGCRATVETAMRVGSGQAGPARRALVNAYSHAV